MIDIYGGKANTSKGDSWDAIVIFSSGYSEKNISSHGLVGTEIYYTLTLKDIYTGNEVAKGKEVSVDNTEYDFKVEDNAASKAIQDKLDSIKDKVDEVFDGGNIVWNFAANLVKNPGGTFVTLICDLFITIGDGIQSLANMVETSGYKKITYTYNKLSDEGDSGENNKYTNVGEYNKSGTWKKVIDVDGSDEKFTKKDTKIPVIPMDMYSLATGEINSWKINFLNGQGEHIGDHAWMFLRNLASAIIHVVMYIASAVLITTLIWHGVSLVRGSLTPKQELDHKEGLERFAKSVLMLIGTVVIMALSIFGSNMFLDDVKMENEDELPIRVNVKSADYSFSTNITGYIRYMAGISEVDACTEKAMYTVIYVFFAIANLAAVLLMFGRMVLILILSVLGPIIATLNALNIENEHLIKYKVWIGLYVSCAAIQIFFAIIYRILLEII